MPYIDMNQPSVYMCSSSQLPLSPEGKGSPSHPLIPQGHPSVSALGTLSRASNLDWQSVSHMIKYMFQCCSLKSSHPRLLLQSPKVCSLHLYLFCCLAQSHHYHLYIYALIFCIGVFNSDLLHSVY